MHEIDVILVDQLHSAKRSRKRLLRMVKIMPDEPLLNIGLEMVDKRIVFFESMIQDKTLLLKKPKKKKEKSLDILAKNPVYEWYKLAYIATTLSYKMVMQSTTNYMNIFKRKNKDDKIST